MRHTAHQPTAPSLPWPVIITEWALDSYLDLKHRQVFSRQEYRTVIRPDVVLLKDGIPSPHAQFTNNKFWGPAELRGVVLPNGFKMKWHHVGPGKVQLRLPVMIGNKEALLCECYEKGNASQEQRRLARFKTHMNLISQGRYVHRGQL